jgi:phosphotransacetylase
MNDVQLTFDTIRDQVKAFKTKSRVAVVMAQDAHALESIFLASKEGLVDPILIGDVEKIKDLLKQQNLPDDVEMIDVDDAEACVAKAADLIRAGQAQIIMKGMMETGQIMKAILDKKNELTSGRKMSLIGFYEIPKYHKLLSVSDMGMNTYPDLAGKKDILENAVQLLHAIGIENPKVAALAAVEKLNPKMPETVDGDKLKEMNRQGEIKGCIVEGPISFDLATSKEAAVIKKYESPVAGDADLLLVPEICTGNVLVKCLTGMAGARTAGLVVGAKVPIILTSRSAESSDKYYSTVFAAYAAVNY